ncbi:MAG: glycosyltransferase, partial [Candidatus Odinarchaeota archaeon]
MRIVHIIPFYGEQHGGSERYVHNLVKHQIKKHDVHIFSTTRLFENRGCIEQEGYTLHRFYSPAVVWNINPICFILHRLAGFEADIIHIHSYLYFSSIQAIFSKRLNQVPMLLHLHGGVGIPPYQTSLIKKSAKIFYDRFIGSYILKNADMIA